MSTLPPLAQVRGKATTPGRRSAPGSGESETSRGTPSASAWRTSRTSVGCVQLPPSQPWKRPPSVTSARSPTRADDDGEGEGLALLHELGREEEEIWAHRRTAPCRWSKFLFRDPTCRRPKR